MEKQPVSRVCVGLDMSLTSTGVCVKCDSNVQLHTIKSDPHKCPNDLDRLRWIVDVVMSKIPPVVPNMVCIEDYFTPSNPYQIGAAIKLVSLGTMMRMKLYESGFPFFVVSPNQLKKYVLGKGAGQKDLILREVFKRWGIDCKDNNQSDACVLAYMAEGLFFRINDKLDVLSLKRYELEVVEKVFKERPRYNVPGVGSVSDEESTQD